MRTMLFAAILIITMFSATALGAAAAPVSVKRGNNWYWSVDFANGTFAQLHVSKTLYIDSADCHGLGSSIPSSDPSIDLYDRFRCRIYGATWNEAKLAKLKQAITSATGLAAKKQAESDYAVYQAHGTEFWQTITLATTGRRDSSITAYGPVHS